MKPNYRSDKATQVVSILLNKYGGTLDRYPLLKLLWLVERTSFERSGRPICYDNYVSMNEGLLPSKTYDLTKGGSSDVFWAAAFEEPKEYEVRMKSDANIPDVLSEYELETINIALDKYGSQSQRAWREKAHEKPLWKGRHYPNTSTPVSYEEILQDVGLGDHIEEIMGDLEAAEQLEKM